MIPQNGPDVTWGREPVFPDGLGDEFRSAEVFFAVMVTLAKNRSYRQMAPWRIHELVQLIKEMRCHLGRDVWVQALCASYSQEPNPSLVSRMLVSFWARVFDISVQEMCSLLDEDEEGTLRRAFGLKGIGPCYPQRISELHQRLGGTEGKEEMHGHLLDLVSALLELERLTEADVEFVAANYAFEPVLGELGRGYGFDYFLGFVFWQGVFVKLERALLQDLRPNGFSLRDLLTAYLERLDEKVKTQDDLAAKLRNYLWQEKEGKVVAPVSQTLTNFLAKLAPDRLVVLYQEEVRQTHRGKKRFVVAVDAVLLELFGRYEGAGWHWDNKEHRAVFGYKLHVLFSVTTGEPVAFYLHQPGDKDADVLDHLVQEARTALGVKELGIILFDKGYWRVEKFRKLVREDRESLITPGKRYKTVEQAIAAIPRGQWKRVGLNLRCAETTVFFGEQGVRFRLMVWKKLGQRVVKDERGRRVRDANGQVVKEPVVICHSYLTNLSEIELEADQLLGMYSQRWGIEDFFEEVQNQYYLTKFPGTSLMMVIRHILLTFYLYILVQRFQKLAAEWLERTDYALMELRRFGKEFLHAPIAYLLWLKAGRPKENAKQSARRSAEFLHQFFSLGSSP